MAVVKSKCGGISHLVDLVGTAAAAAATAAAAVLCRFGRLVVVIGHLQPQREQMKRSIDGWIGGQMDRYIARRLNG